jgi:hypothetical protein
MYIYIYICIHILEYACTYRNIHMNIYELDDNSFRSALKDIIYMYISMHVHTEIYI